MRSIEEPATGKTADSHTYTAHVDCQKILVSLVNWMPLATLRKHKFKSNALLIAKHGSLIITNLLTLPYSLCREAVHYIFRPGHCLIIINICNIFIWLINYFLMYFHWLTQTIPPCIKENFCLTVICVTCGL